MSKVYVVLHSWADADDAEERGVHSLFVTTDRSKAIKFLDKKVAEEKAENYAWMLSADCVEDADEDCWCMFINGRYTETHSSVWIELTNFEE